MTLQWNRKCKLTLQIEKNKPEALDLSDFRITFNISQATKAMPKTAEIYIYNISESTMNRLAGINNEHIDNSVILECGYFLSPLETLFKGRVLQFRRGRSDQTDTWLCILAQSSDKLKNTALVNQVVPAGTTLASIGKMFIEQANQQDIEIGDTVELSQRAYPRGRVFFGGLERNMRHFYEENHTLIDLSDGVLSTMYAIGFMQVPVQVLSKKTGLVNMPQQTGEGVKMTCLLNPKMKWGARVQVNTANLQTEAIDASYASQQANQNLNGQQSNNHIKGEIFLIRSVTHRGDTRGTDWYTDLICSSIDTDIAINGLSNETVSDSWYPTANQAKDTVQ